MDVRRDERVEFPRGEIHLFRARVLGDGFSTDLIRVSNHSMRTIEVPLSIRFDADFANVFEVRGTRRPRRGVRLPDRSGDDYVLGYRGLDDVERRTHIRWSRLPAALEPGVARFRFRLEPHATVAFEMSVSCEEGTDRWEPTDYDTALVRARSVVTTRSAQSAAVHASSESLNRWLKRSGADLQMMMTSTRHGVYPYAGIPWFSAPFGRDGLITAFELLWANPAVAHGVLSFLASTQAVLHSDAQDAEPGKILHEMRRGEMPALEEVPFGRYYGSIDSTPLFIRLARAYCRRTADRGLIDRLWLHLVAAVDWMDRAGDADGDGFLEYARRSENGLVQQGWKDSNDSVFHADGTLAEGPIALCEVQGYAYAAWRGAAELAADARRRRQRARLASARGSTPRAVRSDVLVRRNWHVRPCP